MKSRAKPRINTQITGKRVSWQRRPSEIRGYLTALYMTTEEGDYLRVDYNLKDNRVRVYLEDTEEGGNPYYVVISGGKVTSQRNSTTGRPADVIRKLKMRSNILLTISNKDVLRIVRTSLGLEEAAAEPEKESERRERLDQTRKRYFKPENANDGTGDELGIRPARRILIDTIDIAAGGTLASALFLYYHSYIITGLAAALFGILIGLADMFIRGISPSFVKMLIFILAGLAFYVYGYYMF